MIINDKKENKQANKEWMIIIICKPQTYSGFLFITHTWQNEIYFNIYNNNNDNDKKEIKKMDFLDK